MTDERGPGPKGETYHDFTVAQIQALLDQTTPGAWVNINDIREQLWRYFDANPDRSFYAPVRFTNEDEALRIAARPIIAALLARVAAREGAVQRNQTLTLEIGADSQNDLIAALRHIEYCIQKGSIHVVSGGYSWGGFFDLIIRPEQTHEKWEADLKTYLEAQDG